MRKRIEAFPQTLNDLMEPGLSSRLRKTKKDSAFCQQSPSHLNSQNKRLMGRGNVLWKQMEITFVKRQGGGESFMERGCGLSADAPSSVALTQLDNG